MFTWDKQRTTTVGTVGVVCISHFDFKIDVTRSAGRIYYRGGDESDLQSSQTDPFVGSSIRGSSIRYSAIACFLAHLKIRNRVDTCYTNSASCGVLMLSWSPKRALWKEKSCVPWDWEVQGRGNNQFFIGEIKDRHYRNGEIKSTRGRISRHLANLPQK